MSQNPNDSGQVSLYTSGLPIKNDYSFHPGVCVLPIAEDAPTTLLEMANWSPVVVLRLHAPYRLRRVSYAAVKDNNPPVMPTPQTDSGAFVFIGGGIHVETYLNQSQLNFDWGVQTEYVYAENCVSRPQDGYVLGSPPWTWLSVAINAGTQPAINSPGAVGSAGANVKKAAGLGSQVNFNSSTLPYLYNVPLFLPGTFFSDDLVNGGPSQ